MRFEGYVYKFKLNASHSVSINKKRGKEHSHTFEISLFIKISNEDFFLYDHVEQIVQNFLNQYKEKLLNRIEPFNKIEPTLENLGDVLFIKIKKILDANGMSLIKLEINETPSRVYIAHNQNLKMNESNITGSISGGYKDKIIELSLGTIIDLSARQVMQEFKKIQIENKTSGKSHEIEPENIEAMIIQESHTCDKQNNKEVKNHTVIKAAGSISILIMLAIALVFFLIKSGGYPWGIDTYGHLFKSDLLYNEIKNGNLYPLFTKYWYNGVQPFRYWGPFAYYILAICQFASLGSMAYAYIFFIGFIFLIGGIGWLLWGIKEKRILLSVILGIMWFIFPENLRILFFEGNIPRVVITAFLPYLFYFLWQYVNYERKSSLIPMAIFMSIMIMSHLMVAAMIGITSFIFLLIYSIVNKKYEKAIFSIATMLLSFAICGIWVYPALKGGLVSMDSGATSEVMKSLSTVFTTSLDPLLRISSSGYPGYFYFGLSIIIISALGILLSNKKSMPGFVTVIIIFLGTTTAFIPILSKMPLNQLLWMMRFTPIAYALFVVSILNWKKCRRYFIIIILIILILDSSLSCNISIYPADRHSLNDNIINSAKKITNQRIALLDSSMFGSYPSFFICSNGKKVPYSYGWAWQGAATADNIVLLNTALENGYYNYMFDRSVEMGCDTVIVRKESLKKSKSKLSYLKEGAFLSKFSLYKETEEGYIFHKDTPKNFGIVTKYSGLCIGRSAKDLQLEYPSFEEGTSYNIEDYSIEKLSKYKTIYLSDFRYNNRAKAEKLVSDLSSMGVKIIIDMNRIPNDPETNRMVFLGVAAEPITFDKKLPSLYFEGNEYKSVNFKDDYKNWNTVYLNNVSCITGFSWFKNKKLTFSGKGTGNERNVTFIGFNLMFHTMENDDSKTLDIMNKIIDNKSSVLPEREIVPIDINYNKNQITINSPEENVNTTLAYLDAYRSNNKISTIDNLLIVTKGETNIKVIYSYFYEGILVSIFGVLGLVILLIYINKRGCNK